jgi:hypothetical protein
MLYPLEPYAHPASADVIEAIGSTVVAMTLELHYWDPAKFGFKQLILYILIWLQPCHSNGLILVYP